MLYNMFLRPTHQIKLSKNVACEAKEIMLMYILSGTILEERKVTSDMEVLEKNQFD